MVPASLSSYPGQIQTNIYFSLPSPNLINFHMSFFVHSFPPPPPPPLSLEAHSQKCENTAAKLPPGPRKLPLIGNLHNLVGSPPHHVLRDLASDYGPLMHLQLGEVSVVVVSSPKMAQLVLQTHDPVFAQRPQLLAAKIVSYDGTDIAFSQGEYWRQMRKICNTELLHAKRVQSFSSLREDEVSNLIKSIRLSAGSPINFTREISLMTSSVTARAAFGNKHQQQEAVISLSKESAALSGGFDLADLYPSLEFLHVISGIKPKLERVHEQLDKILQDIINMHKEKLDGTNLCNTISESDDQQEDLVDVLLRLQGIGSLKCPITTRNIKAVILDMISAGTDTAATTITWAMSEIMRNPQVMKQAQVEIRQAFKGKETITEADIQGLVYLKSVIKETLRLHPPVPLLLPRESRENCKIEGYEIPVKTKVIVNAWAIARDGKNWPDADKFIPERFVESSIDFRGKDFAYIPFGAGKRICPGIFFALANMELSLAQLLYHFNWKLPDGITPENLDMSEAFGAVVGKKNNLYLIATPYVPS